MLSAPWLARGETEKSSTSHGRRDAGKAKLLREGFAISPGGFQVELEGLPDSVVLLRASDGLGSWSTVTTVTLTGPTAVVTDPDAIAMPRRYYRLESP